MRSWLYYLAAWIAAFAWIAFWVRSHAVTQDEVTQDVSICFTNYEGVEKCVTGPAVCTTDWECELFDRRNSEVRL